METLFNSLKSLYANIKSGQLKWTNYYSKDIHSNEIVAIYTHWNLPIENGCLFIKYTISFEHLLDEDLNPINDCNTYYVLYKQVITTLPHTISSPSLFENVATNTHNNTLCNFGQYQGIFSSKETAQKAVEKILLEQIEGEASFFSPNQRKEWKEFVKNFEV